MNFYLNPSSVVNMNFSRLKVEAIWENPEFLPIIAINYYLLGGLAPPSLLPSLPLPPVNCFQKYFTILYLFSICWPQCNGDDKYFNTDWRIEWHVTFTKIYCWFDSFLLTEVSPSLKVRSWRLTDTFPEWQKAIILKASIGGQSRNNE